MIDAIYIAPVCIDQVLAKDLFLVNTATRMVHNRAPPPQHTRTTFTGTLHSRYWGDQGFITKLLGI